MALSLKQLPPESKHIIIIYHPIKQVNSLSKHTGLALMSRIALDLVERAHTHTRTPACTQVRFQFKGCSQSLSKLDKPILSSLHLLSDTSLVDNTDICCTPHHSWCACSRLESKRSHSRDLASSWWRSIKESRSQGWVQDGFFRIHRGQSASCLSWISDDLCCALGPPHHHWR